MCLLRIAPALTLLFLIAMAGSGQARPIYLKDGGIVEAESFWRRGDDIFVKVNRDLVIPFSGEEVDLQKTLQKEREKRPVAAPVAAAKKVAPPQSGPAPAPPMAKREQPAGSPAEPAPPLEKQAAAAKAPAAVTPEAIKPSPPARAALPQARPAEPPALSPLAMMGPSAPLLLGVGMIVFALLMIAAHWKLFEKAGVAGWKCLVPIYNFYLLIVIAGKPGWWLILMFIPIVSVAIYLLTMLALAARFGKGPLFAVGLFFLPFVFFPLLGFDSSQYSE